MTKYLHDRDLCLRILGGGMSEIAGALTPVRAHRLVVMLRDEYGIQDLDPALVALAAKKRPGHKGGPTKPPVAGETRQYLVCENGRIGIPVSVIGAAPGDKVSVKFREREIVIKA